MSKLARITVLTTLAAGIALLGLLSGGEHPVVRAHEDVDLMRGYYPVPMPHYPGATEFPLGRQLRAAGTPMKMSYFFTRDDPLKIGRFYTGHWRQAGYHVTEDITWRGGVVAAYDPATGILRQVLIRRRGNRSSVFPSVLERPMRPSTSSGDRSKDVPLYPGSEGVISFDSKDTGFHGRVTMSTNYGGMANNVEFYRTKLPAQGWHEMESNTPSPLPPEDGQTLRFHKGSRELTVAITLLDSEQRVRVYLAEAAGQELGLPAPPEQSTRTKRPAAGGR